MRRSLVLLVALVLLASACGTRVKDQAALSSQANNNLNGAATPEAGAGGATTPAGSGAPMFGSLESPCGPGDGSALPASAQGVTADTIKIGTIADPGGVKPGLDQGVFDSMEAFADWCNAQGGVNGRKLEVTLRDAKITQYKERVAEACAEDFALVGGVGVLDNLGAADADACGIVNVPGAAVNPEVAGSPLVVQPLPNPPGTYQVGVARWVGANYPESIKHAAALRSKLPITEGQSNRLVEGYEQVGFDFVYQQSANVNETNWGPLVVAMKNAGVDYVTLTSSFEEIIPLQKEMANQNFDPKVIELEANFYNQKYPEQAGDIANGTFVRVSIWPFEEADQSPAMTTYLDQLRKTKGADVQPELLGVQAWSAGLLFATAAKAAGANLTRESLMAELKKVHAWNGGGLHGTSDPGNNVPSTCLIVMEVKDGGFARRYPLPDADKAVYDEGKGWSCPPLDQGLVKVDPTGAGGAK